MIEFLLGFIFCFILISILSSYFVKVPMPPNYKNSSDETHLVCETILKSRDYLQDSLSDLDERLDDLYREYFSLKTKLFKDDLEVVENE